MTVSKRKNRDTWQFVVDLPRGADGKRRQVTRGGYKSRTAAREAERAFLNEQDDGLEVAHEKDSTAEYLERWLKTYAEPRVAPSTLKRYRELVRVHAIPAIGSIPLRRLRPLDVEALYQRVTDATSPSTAHHVHRCLSVAFRQAVRWRLLGRNPIEAVHAPTVRRPVHKVPTIEELMLLMREADTTEFATLDRLALLTGLRQGELCALKWEFVDLDAGEISVRASAGREKGKGVVIRQPKTTHSVRTFSLGRMATDLLLAHRERQRAQMAAEPLDYQRNDYVFADALGRPYDPMWVSKVWARLADRVGLGAVRFHDLRHGNATLLLRAGVPMKVVQTRLGHATISTTADIYSHVTPDLDRGAADALDALLGGQ